MKHASKPAFRFVLLMSVVSLFADMTYEGARSALGPFFATLGASGAVVGFVSGLGELLGFGLRYLSGIAADRTRRYWDLGIAGYAINVLSVPALALAHTWPAAAALVLGERTGRGLRKPATSALMSYAGSQLGHGWVFGFREAMDQTGATIGPLLVAGALFLGYGFNKAFAMLALPALLALAVLLFARNQFPIPQSFEAKLDEETDAKPSIAFWIYAAGAALIAAGFADFALVAFHFSKAHTFSNDAIPILYAGAMLAAAAASPLLGIAYDRFGNVTVLFAFLLASAYAPLAFLGGPLVAIAGAVLWGVGMAAQDVLFPAIVAKLVPANARARAFGTFDAIYGIAWFAGSTLMGVLYDRSLVVVVVISLVLQLVLGLPLLAIAASRGRTSGAGNNA